MPVSCAKCGEELLGAINRCWRCGTEYESRSGESDLPPVRRTPIRGPLDGALDAQLIESEVDVEPGSTSSPETDSQVDTAAASDSLSDVAVEPGRAQMRRGSPFRPKRSGEANDDVPLVQDQIPRTTVYPKAGGAAVGSAVGITLGLIALSLARFIPVAGVLLAIFGLAMGVWGLYSKYRIAAIVALLFCCVAIMVAGFFGAAQLFEALYGVSPWEDEIPPAP